MVSCESGGEAGQPEPISGKFSRRSAGGSRSGNENKRESRMSFSTEYDAGYEAGQKDARDGKPIRFFPERSSTFRLGYREGFRAGQVGPQEVYVDMISDHVLAHDIEQEA